LADYPIGHPSYDSINNQGVNNMPNFEKLSVEAVLKLPPMLFGVIRWKKSIGSPSGDPCNGFRIRVEERTPSEFRAGPGGVIEKIPGTGIWRLVTDAASCFPAPDEGDSHVVHFRVPDVHLNVLDGAYRITPQLTGQWDSRGLVFLYLFGFRQIDPLAWYIALRADSHIATVEFEVVRRFWFRSLSAHE
jgi:hypothetical protein